MIHTLGWAWSTAEAELDLHRLHALTRHWRQCPPVHVLVAAYLGYEAPRTVGATTEATGELAQVLSSTPVDRSAAALNNSAWQQFAQSAPPPRIEPHG